MEIPVAALMLYAKYGESESSYQSRSFAIWLRQDDLSVQLLKDTLST